MKLYFRYDKPWYLATPREQFWRYYDERTRVYFCFARWGKKEYQGASSLSFERAYDRLSQVASVAPYERFVLHNRQSLREVYNDTVNIF